MLSKKLKRILKSSPATKELIGFLEDVDTKLNSGTSETPSTPSSGNTGQTTIFEPNTIYFTIPSNVKINIDTDVDEGVSVYNDGYSTKKIIDLSDNIHIYDYWSEKYESYSREFYIYDDNQQKIVGFTVYREPERIFISPEYCDSFSATGFEWSEKDSEYVAEELPQEINIVMRKNNS